MQLTVFSENINTKYNTCVACFNSIYSKLVFLCVWIFRLCDIIISAVNRLYYRLYTTCQLPKMYRSTLFQAFKHPHISYKILINNALLFLYVCLKYMYMYAFFYISHINSNGWVKSWHWIKYLIWIKFWIFSKILAPFYDKLTWTKGPCQLLLSLCVHHCSQSS